MALESQLSGICGELSGICGKLSGICGNVFLSYCFTDTMYLVNNNKLAFLKAVYFN